MFSALRRFYPSKDNCESSLEATTSSPSPNQTRSLSPVHVSRPLPTSPIMTTESAAEFESIDGAWRECWHSLTDRERLMAVCGNANVEIVPLKKVHIHVANEGVFCGICRETFDGSDVVHLKQCGHYFDVDCMDERIASGDLECPTCSASLVTPDRSALESAFHGTPEWKVYEELCKAGKKSWFMVEHGEDDFDFLNKDRIMEDTAFLERSKSFEVAQTIGVPEDQAWHMIEHGNEDWEMMEKNECREM